MHLPYIKHIFGDHDFKLVPIIVGKLEYEKAQEYGEIFSKYMKDENTLFVISSDFCHWGFRFAYMPYEEDISDTISMVS